MNDAIGARPGKGRVALVLAGTRGLGRGCADALAAAGFAVGVCARSAEDVAAAVADLRQHGVEATGRVVDVRDSGELRAFVDQVVAELGGLDVLVANAGGPERGAVLELDDDDWAAAFELTFMSAVRAIRLAVPPMRQRGGGRVIVIGSSSVRQPLPAAAPSNAFRPALLGVVTSLAIELAPERITVNMVSPGRVSTDRVRENLERVAERDGEDYETLRARSEASIPMGRFGEPAELGAMVAFLAGPAAGYVTGQSILVDGGLVRSLA